MIATPEQAAEVRERAEREIEEAIRNALGRHYSGDDGKYRPKEVAIRLGEVRHRGGVDVPDIAVTLR